MAEMREIGAGRVEISWVPRPLLNIEIAKYCQEQGFKASRVEAKEQMRAGGLDGDFAKIWILHFFKQVELEPVASTIDPHLKKKVAEQFAFEMTVPIDRPAHSDEQIAAQCFARGIQRWRSTFQRRHNEQGVEVYWVTVFAEKDISPKTG